MVQLSGIAKKVPTSFLGAFSKTIGYIFIFIFIVIPILYAISLSVKDRNIKSGISYLSPKFLGATRVLQEKSQEIIENKGVYERTEHVWGGIWNSIVDNWHILSSIYIIYLWIWILSCIWARSPFSNTSNFFINFSIGIIFFLLIQIIFLMAVAPMEERWTQSLVPLKSFYTFARALPYFVQPIAEISGDTIIENTTKIINITNHTIS